MNDRVRTISTATLLADFIIIFLYYTGASGLSIITGYIPCSNNKSPLAIPWGLVVWMGRSVNYHKVGGGYKRKCRPCEQGGLIALLCGLALLSVFANKTRILCSKCIFSLLQPVIFPQCGHSTCFPSILDITKEANSLKSIGIFVHSLQLRHLICDLPPKNWSR